MKLLLCKSITNVGIVGDVIDVTPGYARNFLLPRQYAIEPTETNIRRLADARKVAEQDLAEQRRLLEALAKRIDGLEVTIAARANEDGALYGSVGRKEIAHALSEEGYIIQVDHIALLSPIRRLDNVPVEIRFSGDVRSYIKVWVVREKTGEEGAESEGREGDKVTADRPGREAGKHDDERRE
ncbi:MAG: 50S ribosomal protein L9 [Planctomycetes bacterium]|nr:50S ribosomal protein L9 [Planctomycetota bacterium]MBI3833246.1 50S ribosomal protein L9 [Planctomycetota bacterium]